MEFYELLYFSLPFTIFQPRGSIKHFTEMTMHKFGRKCQVGEFCCAIIYVAINLFMAFRFDLA